ncbi:MAG TPA: NAD(P)/FAD-dependent oxidoreductase [Thermoleophilaceae bacterium]|nr:NAD(P)/FAD-dependent oxidoreductase [Thermoleophilaceae bacterium]
MPVRATKRGEERTPLSGDYDVLICGASFAGLAIARELAGTTRPDGTPARVLMIDRYEIGERQTSACGVPTGWLEALDLMGAHRQTFSELVIATPHGTTRWPIPWTFSTFDYPELCSLLAAQGDAEFETAKVDGRTGNTVHTDRGDLTAPLIVDCLGWRRVLAAGDDPAYQPPDAPLSRGLEVHPTGQSPDLKVWIDRSIVPEGYGWIFPAGDELRIGVGSFDPKFHVKDNTVKLAQDLGTDAVGFQGNWIPHKLRDAVEDGIFFAGDSAGHCLPLTAEGIRTALYFGVACGRELRSVLEGDKTREQALGSYFAFSASHEWKYTWLLRGQRLLPRIQPRLAQRIIEAGNRSSFLEWSFSHYWNIATPDIVTAAPSRSRRNAIPTSAAA